MKSRNLFVVGSLWGLALSAFSDTKSPFLQWEPDICLESVGEVFVYDNPYSGKTDYFQLSTVVPGGHCPYFPTNETSSSFWTYLANETAAFAAAEANAALKAATPTTLTDIDHPPSYTPMKTPARGGCAGCVNAQNVEYSTRGQPGNGFDALSFRMRPLSGPESGGAPYAYFWAHHSFFSRAGDSSFYFGLQPEGQFGKTVLFSVFGAGVPANPDYKYCVSDGAVTSCHIPYEWEIGKDYDFMVLMSKASDHGTTWEAYIYDVERQQNTFVGAVNLAIASGIEQRANVAFNEYYLASPCPEQPFCEVLFFAPVSYYRGKPYAGHVSSLNLNGSCNGKFYSDNSSYVYIESGNTTADISVSANAAQ